MTKWHLTGTAATLLALSAGGALADVTPEQALADLRKMIASGGQEMTAASERREGDALVLDGVRFVSEEAGTRIDGTVERLTFRDMGDGTVEITSTPDYRYTVTTTLPASEENPDPQPTVVNLNVNAPDTVMTASGDEAERTYEYTMPEVQVTVGGVEAEGVAEDSFNLLASFDAVAGNYVMSGENDMTSEGRADQARFQIGAAAADGSGRLAMNATMDDIALNATGTGMGAFTGQNLTEAVEAGLSSLLAMSYASSEMMFDFTANDGTTATGNGTSGVGTMKFGLTPDGMSYGGETNDAAFTMTTSQLPFPIEAAYELSSFDMTMPISVKPEPQDFRLSTRVEGLTVSDDVWGLVDPGKALPRDPATLVIDTKGTATVTADYMNPEVAETMAAPFEINSLDVNALRLTVAGGDLRGNGALTFDNSDLVTWGGTPAPTGVMEFTLKGGNFLIDKAVELGFVPQDQAMGARMMLAMFARPVEGEEDSLASKVEFRDKHLYVNGQMLR